MNRSVLSILSLLILLNLFLLFFTQQSVSAATIYVDSAAASGGNGSSADPFNKIQDGIDSASAGDSVQVAAGISP